MGPGYEDPHSHCQLGMQSLQEPTPGSLRETLSTHCHRVSYSQDLKGWGGKHSLTLKPRPREATS